MFAPTSSFIPHLSAIMFPYKRKHYSNVENVTAITVAVTKMLRIYYNLLRFYYIFEYIDECTVASVYSAVTTMCTSYRLEIKSLTLQVN